MGIDVRMFTVMRIEEYTEKSNWVCLGGGGGSQKLIAGKESCDVTLNDTHHDALGEPLVDYSILQRIFHEP